MTTTEALAGNLVKLPTRRRRQSVTLEEEGARGLSVRDVPGNGRHSSFLREEGQQVTLEEEEEEAL